MPRVKRGILHAKKRKRILSLTKGYRHGKKKLIRQAIEASHKAGKHAYRGRKLKKRTNRRLWQVRLNAAVRQHDLTYSKFINLLKVKKIGLDRKVLADIALNYPAVFEKIIAAVKK